MPATSVTPISDLLNKLTAPNTTKAVHGLTNAVTGLGVALQNLGEVAVKMGPIITNAVIGMAYAIGDAFADALSGTDTFLNSFFKGMIGIVSQFMQALGQALIAAGMAAMTFKMLLAKPLLAVGAGIALVAASGVVRGIMQGGPAEFAEGGIVSGPTLGWVGEYPGARNNPEVIAPLDKLQGMMGGAMKVEVVGKLSGRDMYLVQKRYQEYKNQYN
jgi:hypothetical protein